MKASESNSRLRFLLYRLPSVYNLVPRLMGAEPAEEFFSRYVGSVDGLRVLDIGCGPGKYGTILGRASTYLGIEPNEHYVRSAREKAAPHMRYLCSGIQEVDLRGEHFDLVVCLGVLHHLPDDVVRLVADLARRALGPKGRFLSVDPVRLEGQRTVARFLVGLDRGQHVRRPDQLLPLLEGLPGLRHEVRHDRFRNVPYDHIVTLAGPGEADAS